MSSETKTLYMFILEQRHKKWIFFVILKDIKVNVFLVFSYLDEKWDIIDNSKTARQYKLSCTLQNCLHTNVM